MKTTVFELGRLTFWLIIRKDRPEFFVRRAEGFLALSIGAPRIAVLW